METDSRKTLQRLESAKTLFMLDETLSYVHYGPITRDSISYAHWFFGFEKFVAFLKKVNPKIIHLTEVEGTSGYQILLQFVENCVMYSYVWESEDFVDFPDDDDDDDDYVKEYEMTMKVRNEIDSPDVIEKITNSIKCYGPQKVVDRRRASAAFLEAMFDEKFPKYDWYSGIYEFYDVFAESLEKRHNLAEKEFLGVLEELIEDIRLSERDWGVWTVATKKKVAASWLKTKFGFESSTVAQELASFKTRK